MPTGLDDVRFRGKTGSHGQTGKMTRLTQAGPLPISGRSWSPDQLLGIAFVGQEWSVRQFKPLQIAMV